MVETGGSEVHVYPWLYFNSKDSLRYRIAYNILVLVTSATLSIFTSKIL